jgi:hypothetical protein
MPATGCQRGFTVRCSQPNRPMKTIPSAITTTPAIRVRRSRHWMSQKPAAPNATPNATKTTAKPRMNRPTPDASRRRPRRSAADERPSANPPM